MCFACNFVNLIISPIGLFVLTQNLLETIVKFWKYVILPC